MSNQINSPRPGNAFGGSQHFRCVGTAMAFWSAEFCECLGKFSSRATNLKIPKLNFVIGGKQIENFLCRMAELLELFGMNCNEKGWAMPLNEGAGALKDFIFGTFAINFQHGNRGNVGEVFVQGGHGHFDYI